MSNCIKQQYRDFHQYDVPVPKFLSEEKYVLNFEDKHSEQWVPFLSFPITQICNFHCVYCGVGGEATASDNKMFTPEMVEKLIPVAAKMGIRKFRITGGEPFTHPDIRKILKIMSDSGYFTLVNTNGSLIIKHQDVFDTLKHNVHFAVSLDTLDPKRLQQISGSPLHKNVIEGIRLLAKTGHLMRINMVVTQMNYDELPDIIRFCQELKCDLKLLDVVSVPVPFGQRQTIYKEINTLEKQMAETCDEILSHEYTRGFGTPCYRYRFGDTCVTVKNSQKGSHYDRNRATSICKDCPYFPCHEGLYDIFSLADGRICSCRWTEKQESLEPEKQIEYLIDAFRHATYIRKSQNTDMVIRTELKQKRGL